MDTELKTLSDNFLSKIKRESVTPNRQDSSGIVSQDNQSGVIFDSDGNTEYINNSLNQTKLSNESQTQTDICYEKNIITNRINIKTDDLFLNDSRINPQLYNLSAFSQNDICTQGDLNLYGTVLVKCYDKSLQKVVYIRRRIRTPMMYSAITTATTSEQFGLNTDNNEVTI